MNSRVRTGSKILIVLGLLLSWSSLPVLRAASALGDGGHFLSQAMPEVYLQNPDGRAFSVTVHRYIWPVPSFNGGFSFSIETPGGEKLSEVKLPADETEVTLTVPKGVPGIYRLRGRVGGYAMFWIESDLDRMVAWVGDIGTTVENTPEYKVLSLHAIVPRRWYFYVPEGTKSFDVRTVIGTWQTHREDFGFVVMNPRGQRVAALYGGLSPSENRLKDAGKVVSTTIEPDAGTTGRFWSIWVTGGDSHCYSDFRIVLDGVPPFVATSPEEWFDGHTGELAPRLVYDESPIRDVPPEAELHPLTGLPLSGDRYRWAPAPFLGDEDYNGVRGAASVFLFNPENRALDFGAGSYLPPGGEQRVDYSVFGPDGKAVLKETRTFDHQKDYRIYIPPSGPGVYRVEVNAPTWYGWSEPAVPMVLAGQKVKGVNLFRLELSIARHWFFRVPEGTKEFRIDVDVADPDHVLLFEVHAPDRLMEPVHVRGGNPKTLVVPVPPGEDGKTWFFRTEVGSPTRFTSRAGEAPQNTRIAVDVALTGVPGFLAPTWEQWFDPEAP